MEGHKNRGWGPILPRQGETGRGFTGATPVARAVHLLLDVAGRRGGYNQWSWDPNNAGIQCASLFSGVLHDSRLYVMFSMDNDACGDRDATSARGGSSRGGFYTSYTTS